MNKNLKIIVIFMCSLTLVNACNAISEQAKKKILTDFAINGFRMMAAQHLSLYSLYQEEKEALEVDCSLDKNFKPCKNAINLIQKALDEQDPEEYSELIRQKENSSPFDSVKQKINNAIDFMQRTLNQQDLKYYLELARPKAKLSPFDYAKKTIDFAYYKKQDKQFFVSIGVNIMKDNEPYFSIDDAEKEIKEALKSTKPGKETIKNILSKLLEDDTYTAEQRLYIQSLIDLKNG